MISTAMRNSKVVHRACIVGLNDSISKKYVPNFVLKNKQDTHSVQNPDFHGYFTTCNFKEPSVIPFLLSDTGAFV